MNETLVFKDHRKLQTCFRHLLSISSAYCFIVLIEIKISRSNYTEALFHLQISCELKSCEEARILLCNVHTE